MRISHVGLRGVVGSGMTAAHVLDFACAFGTFIEGTGPVVIGQPADARRATPVAGFGATATLAIVSRSIVVTRTRVAAVKLHCGSAVRCDGSVMLRAGQKLGSRTFSLAAGQTRSVGVTLTRDALARLTRAGRLSAQVTIALRQPSGGTTTTTHAVTLVRR